MLFVDVKSAAHRLEGTTRHQVSRGRATAAADLGESSDEIWSPRSEGAAAPEPRVPELVSGALRKALLALDDGVWVDELERLSTADEPAFRRLLQLAFEPGSVTAFDWDAAYFLTTVARNFLSRLELTPERWLRVVLAAAWAENNAVLDTAVQKAKGCDGAALQAAVALAKSFEAGDASTARRLTAALERCR